MIGADERGLLARSIDAAVDASAGAAGTQPLDDALDEIGWDQALAVDPEAAVSLLFTSQGRACATSAAIEAVVRHGLGVELPPRAAVLLPTVGRSGAPGSLRRGDASALEIRGTAPARTRTASEVVVVVDTESGHEAVVVSVESLLLRTVAGLDPTLDLVEVSSTQLVARPVDGVRLEPGVWDAAIALGRLALSHEMVGVSRAMLDLACEHAVGRSQFGAPIAGFQAVRHHLAEALVEVEAAEGVTAAAWEEGTAAAAACAKGVAGSSARSVSRHAQQVLAGVGFTTAHPLHRYVRRSAVLDGLLGDAATITREMGERLLGEHRLEPQLPL